MPLRRPPSRKRNTPHPNEEVGDERDVGGGGRHRCLRVRALCSATESPGAYVPKRRHGRSAEEVFNIHLGATEASSRCVRRSSGSCRFFCLTAWFDLISWLREFAILASLLAWVGDLSSPILPAAGAVGGVDSRGVGLYCGCVCCPSSSWSGRRGCGPVPARGVAGCSPCHGTGRWMALPCSPCHVQNNTFFSLDRLLLGHMLRSRRFSTKASSVKMTGRAMQNIDPLMRIIQMDLKEIHSGGMVIGTLYHIKQCCLEFESLITGRTA